MKKLRTILTLFVATVLFPCSPDTSPRFIPGYRPEQTNTRFVKGELGILTPYLGKRYELIAWRYLAALPLNAEEQAAVVKPPPAVDDAGGWEWMPGRQKFFSRWKQSTIAQNQFYENCLLDSLVTATATLADRRVKYGNDAMVNRWMDAQTQVFSNCSGEKPDYPADPDPTFPALARADRIYQLAAAHFYAEDLDGALQRFRAIAADNASPWRATAAYMVARVLLRESVLAKKPGAATQAKAQLIKVAADPGEGRFQAAASHLVDYANTVLDPGAVFASIGKQMAASHPGPVLADTIAAANYVMQTDRFKEPFSTLDLPAPFDWIRSFETSIAVPKDIGYALRRWKQTHSELWLVPAIMNAIPEEPDTPALVEAANKVPETSPAYDTVTFHAIRLTIAAGKAEAARARLDRLLARPGPLASVDNAFRSQRLSLAINFDDFLRWAARRPIGYIEEDLWGDDPGVDGSPIMDNDSIAIFNRDAALPRLAQAAESSLLPRPVRADLALIAMTRALILGDDKVAAQMLPVVASAHPQWAADLEAYASAPGAEKRFAGDFLIERHGEFRTDQSNWPNDGWWCPSKPLNTPAGPLAAHIFSGDELKTAAQQDQRIADAGSAQAFLAPTVMAWAKEYPSDPRVPEALGRIVRMTRYGCRYVEGLNNGPISKAAYDMLHQKYPASSWAKQTPYWFKD